MTALLTLRLRRGLLQLDRATYASYFAPLTGIILLHEHEQLLAMPVRLAGAGGYLIKVRNAAGDRVIDAADFFRTNGIEDSTEIEFAARWDEARAALVATWPSA